MMTGQEIHGPLVTSSRCSLILSLAPVSWRMSALGHKRTSDHVQSMSALPPKADIETGPVISFDRVQQTEHSAGRI